MFFQKKTALAGFGSDQGVAYRGELMRPVDAVAKHAFKAVHNLDTQAYRMKQEQAVMRKAMIYRSMLTLVAVVQFLGISMWVVLG